MADFVDDLFDPEVPVARDWPERLHAVNAAKARSRVVALLRARPLTGERAVPLAVLLDHLDVRRMRAALASLCADPEVPALNRAAPAYLLARDDLDPGVPAERWPILAEGLLLGCAVVGDLQPLGPILAAMCGSGAVDVDAMVERIERWRLAAAAPGDVVYGGILGSAGCAASHARVLAVLESDPGAAAVVRAAADGGTLDRGLADAFLARPPGELPAGRGHAWVGSRCSGCGGRTVTAAVHVGDGLSVGLEVHLSPQRCSDALVQPLLGESFTRRLVDEGDAADDRVEVDLGSLAATARTAAGDGEADQRALWLLRRIAAAPDDIEVAMALAIARDLDHVRDVIASIAGDVTDEEDLDEAVEVVVEALEVGVYSPPMVEDDDHAVWLELLAVVVGALERLPIRWDERVCGALQWAWSAIADAADEAEEERGLLPSVRRLVPVERADRLAWRAVLMAVVAEDDHLDDDLLDRPGGLVGAIMDHLEALERLGHTVRDAVRDVGGPDALVGQLAESLGITADEPLVNAFVDADAG